MEPDDLSFLCLDNGEFFEDFRMIEDANKAAHSRSFEPFSEKHYVEQPVENFQQTPLSQRCKVHKIADSKALPKGYPQKRRALWTVKDDIFLTGITLDVYCLRHSLRPTEAERTEARNDGRLAGKLVWQEIHEKYQLATRRYFELYGHLGASRTMKALQKRWKDTGKYGEQQVKFSSGRLTKHYSRLWDDKFNKNCILTGPEEKYQELKRQIRLQQCTS